MIYFIQNEDNGHIKIGWGIDPKKRLAILQIGNSSKLTLLKSVPSYKAAEFKIHRELATFRVSGEWFRGCQEVLEYMGRFGATAEYELYGTTRYLIVWRQSGSQATEPCGFCGKPHLHSQGDGHRASHCTDRGLVAYAPDGTLLRSIEGYIVKTRR